MKIIKEKEIKNNYMKNTIITITLFLLLLPIGKATVYSCQPVVVDIIQQINYAYTANTPFDVEVTITNFPSDKNVFSDIIDDKGNVVQTKQGTYIGDNEWKFYFDPLSPGTYTIETRLIHPTTGEDVVETSQPFSSRTKLSVTFTSTQPTLNTIEDISLNLWVRPIPPEDWEKVLTVKKLELIGSKDIPLTPKYENCAGDFCNVIIPKGYITDPGVYTFTITVSDRNRLYDPETKSIESIEVVHPKVGIILDAPVSAQAGKSYDITITTTGVGGNPMDVDKLELRITWPGGTEQVYETTDFIHTPGSGEYIMSFTFTSGQQHYFKVSAWESEYLSSYLERNIPVSGGAVTEVCDNYKDDDGDGLVDMEDPDCIYGGGGECEGLYLFGQCITLGLGLIIILGIVAVFIIAFWRVRGRK